MEDNLLIRARRVLAECLAQGPEPGARLKQRLQREFERFGARFDERAWGYARFSEFLAANDDLVLVRSSGGPGDISVELRPRASADAVPPTVGTRLAARAAPFVPRDLWQAFTNPDPTRLRFYNRELGGVEHFTANDAPQELAAVEANRSFVRIPPIPADEQLTWMKEFLTTAAGIPADRRAVLERVIVGPYATSLNQVYAGALGQPHGVAWRQFRAAKVFDRVRTWAEANGVTIGRPTLQHTQPVEAAPGRRQLLDILELLTDDELHSLRLPLGVVARLVGRRNG